MIYEETLETLKDQRPGQVRRFLMAMGDDERLRAWDNSKLRERDNDG